MGGVFTTLETVSVFLYLGVDLGYFSLDAHVHSEEDAAVEVGQDISCMRANFTTDDL